MQHCPSEGFVVEVEIAMEGSCLEGVDWGKRQGVSFDVAECLEPFLATYRAEFGPSDSCFVLVAFVAPVQRQGQRFAEEGTEVDFEEFQD